MKRKLSSSSTLYLQWVQYESYIFRRKGHAVEALQALKKYGSICLCHFYLSHVLLC